MSDCPYGTMDWYCVLQEGHEGDHKGHTVRTVDEKKSEGQATAEGLERTQVNP